VLGAALLLAADFPRKDFLSTAHSYRELIAVAAKYKANSVYGLPHSLVDNMFPMLIAAVVSHRYGLTELGFYNICLKFRMPFIAVSNSLGMLRQKDVMDERDGVATDNPGKHSSMRRPVVFALLLSPLLILAPIICQTFLAAQWVQAGYYALICSPTFILTYFIGSFGATAYLLNRQRVAFRFGVLFNLAQFLPFGIVFISPQLDFISMRDALLISSALCSAVLGFHLRWLLKISSPTYVRQCA
jgi:O-antigen/teichoic acid export membrane protein